MKKYLFTYLTIASSLLILSAHTSGLEAPKSKELALLYYEKCQTLPHLTIMIEGVSKPTPLPYIKSIRAFNCVNYYQPQSNLHSAPIANCKNKLMPNSGKEKGNSRSGT